MKFSTCDLCDQYPNKVMTLAPVFKSYGAPSSFCGEVVTVKCFEDNSMVKQLCAETGHGRVLVVDGGGSLQKALMGDLIAADFVKNGWSGIVIYGCIRDVEEVNSMDLGVRALNSIPLKTDRKGLGEINIPVEITGITISPGNYLYADETGIIISETELSDY